MLVLEYAYALVGTRLLKQNKKQKQKNKTNKQTNKQKNQQISDHS